MVRLPRVSHGHERPSPTPALDGNLPEPAVCVGKYGVIEVQTTDTHGTYKHAVNALTNALDLHLIIGTDAATLSRAAFDIAPAKAVEYGAGVDAVVSAIIRRLAAYLPSITALP